MALKTLGRLATMLPLHEAKTYPLTQDHGLSHSVKSSPRARGRSGERAFRVFRPRVVIIVAALALFGSAMAGPLKDGEAADNDADKDVIAQDAIGSMYALGLGAPQDYARAAFWYRKAADRGYAHAQLDLAHLYQLGFGVPRDDGQAAFWYRKAAEQGDDLAQVVLGDMYKHGQGVPENFAQAEHWYREAANQGDATGQYDVGLMFATGRGGVLQDYISAHMWLNLAASRADDALIRDAAVKDRDGVAAKMTPAQIAEAQRMAREWKPK